MSSIINLISIGNKEFNLSLMEVKQFLKFNLFVEDDFRENINFENYDVIMIHKKKLDKEKIDFLNRLEKIIVLISERETKLFSNKFSVIKLPVKLDDINSIILNLDIKKKVTKEDVNKAYIKIQKKIHPDISPETSRLSSIVNEAKDIVLNDIS